MDFDLTKEQEMIRKEVRKFAVKEIAPVAEELDEKETFSEDLTRKMGEIGLFGMFVSEEYGGTEMGYVAYIIAVEELARALESLGQLEGAIQAATEALTLEPFAWRHLQRLGLALFRAGRADEGTLAVTPGHRLERVELAEDDDGQDERVDRETEQGLRPAQSPDRSRAGIAQDERQLLRRQAPVERHANSSDLGEREEALHVLDAVHLQERHAVAFRHAEPAQEVGGAVGAGVPLREGEAPVGVEVHEAAAARDVLDNICVGAHIKIRIVFENGDQGVLATLTGKRRPATSSSLSPF